MENKIKQIYYDPEQGFSNVNQLYNKLKELGYSFTLSEVKKWYNSQAVNQIYKEPKPVYQKIVCPFGSVGCIQCDLMDINKFFRQNEGYHYIFNAIDIFSRYLWAYPIKNKKATSTLECLKNVIKEIKSKYPDNVIAITCDNGSEFLGAFKKYLDSEKIFIFYNDPYSITAKTHMGIVERVNRTMWGFIKKYTAANNTLKFVDRIPEFVKNYNNKVHGTIKMKPIDAFNGTKIPIHENNDIVSEINIGDKVRTIRKINKFDKAGFSQKWSEIVYEVIEKNGNRYSLKNTDNGKKLTITYLPRELQKIDSVENITNIEPEIKETNKKNKFVRKQNKYNIGIVNKDTGHIEPENKRMIPKNEKRIIKSKNENEYEVDSIVDDKIGNDNKKLYRIHWKGYPSDQDTWQGYKDVKNLKAYDEYIKMKKKL